nr:ABC transporter ATP-binding protein [Ammoniphilus resinae]
MHEVNLHIGQGELCALVGRNGAGKSTLIHSILGLLPYKNGEILIKGISNRKEGWKSALAYLPEKFHLYPHLTGEENFHFFASLEQEVNQQRMEESLRLVDLWEHRGQRVAGYSKGMLQRLGLAMMLYYRSDILILDEPTSGLDPVGRKEVLSVIKRLKGKTILFSSHHIDEIIQICSHVAFLEEGRLQKYSLAEFLQVYSW